jgi:hypothetical protein
VSKNFFRVDRGLSLSGQTADPVLDVKEGDIYFNSALQAFRGYYNGAWRTLGSGSGNPTLETLKNQFVDSPFQLMTPNIMLTDEGTKFASFTGAAYSAANSVINFSANSQVATSVQMLDSTEFLPYGIDMTSIDLSAFWSTKAGLTVPDAATTYSGLNVTVTNTSSTVIVTTPVEHDLKTGSRITVTTATAIGGISSGNLSQANTAITVLSPQQFSYAAGAAASSTASGTLDTLAVLGFKYEVSRDGGTNWFTVPMSRVGTTEAFRGPFTWDNTTANTESTQQSLATQTGTVITRTLAASSSDQQLSQSFVVTSGQTWVIKKVILNVTKTGTPGGNIYVSLVKNATGNIPSLVLSDMLGQSNAVVASGLTTGANTITMPTTVLTPGTYHVVVSSDAAYKATGSFGSNNIALQEASSLTGESSYNGTVWSTVAARGLIYTLQGRSLDLRVRISSPTSGTFTYPSGLDGYGIFYNLQDVGIVGQSKKNQKFVFNSVTDNLSSFALTAFNPDPDLLTCWYIEGGQGFKVPAFNLNGNTAVFPANTFNNGGVSATMTLVFEQNNGGGYDNSDMNANLLAQNFLGSEATTFDRSVGGRGIKLRKPNGTLVELSVDNSNNIVISSLP